MFRGPQEHFKGNYWMPKTISQELEAQNSKLTATEMMSLTGQMCHGGVLGDGGRLTDLC